MNGSRTAKLTTAALLAALLCASAWISVPVGAVPVTLQVFVVVLIALVLSADWAAAAVGVYLLVGVIGVPVFAGVRGGFAVLAGPTGGYLLGFVFGAWIGAWTREALAGRVRPVVADGAAALVVVTVVYFLGALQLSAITGLGPFETVAAGVLPFVVPDLVKAAVATSAAAALRAAGVVRVPVARESAG